MKKSELSTLIREAVKEALLLGQAGPAREDQLDDATQLLMMVSGRIMSAKEGQLSSEILDQVIHHIEQADGLLDKAGLKADSSDIARMSESLKRLK